MSKIAMFFAGILLVGATIAQAAGRPFVSPAEKQFMAAGFMGQNASCISKATAEKDALAAVNGGTVVAVVFEGGDNPRHWSVDITHKDGTDYEVWVSCTGKIINVIKGK